MFGRLFIRHAPSLAFTRAKATSADDFFVGSKIRLRTKTRKYPLSGIRVALLGPPSIGEFTAHILEDFGADVVKFCDLSSLHVDDNQNCTCTNSLCKKPNLELTCSQLVQNYVYSTPNQRPQSLDVSFKVGGSRRRIIDLTMAEDVNLIRNICGNVDILIDCLHGGKLEQVELNPELLLKTNLQLIVARVTAYGQNAPLGHTMGSDATIAALSGAFQKPYLKNDGNLKASQFEFKALSMAGQSQCVSAVLLALYERECSGRGQIIDISVTENISYLDRVNHETSIDIPKQFNRFYATSDKKIIAVSILSKSQQEKFLQISGSSLDGDVEANIVRRMTQKNLVEWLELFKDISSVIEVLDHKTVGTHKQHREREAFGYDVSTNRWVAKTAPRFNPQ